MIAKQEGRPVDGGKIVASGVGLFLAGLIFYMGNNIPTTQSVTLNFRPGTGSAKLEFLTGEWDNSPICSCNEPWRGIGFPVNQYDLGVDGGHPWSLIVGPIDHSVPANWWQDPEAEFTSSVSVKVSRNERTIYTIADAPAGLTIESSGPKIGIFTEKSAFSAVMPPDEATTSIHTDPVSVEGVPGGFNSMAIEVPTKPGQDSDYRSESDEVGSNYRATMIDTLGPVVELSLGQLMNGHETGGSFRLWVGTKEVALPEGGVVTISMRTDFAIRLRPLPLNHTLTIGDPPSEDTSIIPQVSAPIPSHTISIDDAMSEGGDVWKEFVRAVATQDLWEKDGGGTPIRLPETPSISVYGRLALIESSAMVGNASAISQTEVAPGDLVRLESQEGFDFRLAPLELMATTTEGVPDPQYLHGQGTGSVTPAKQSGWIEAVIDWVAGTTITKTQWLLLLAPVLLSIAGSVTVWEVIQYASYRRSSRLRKRSSPTSSATRVAASKEKATGGALAPSSRPDMKTGEESPKQESEGRGRAVRGESKGVNRTQISADERSGKHSDFGKKKNSGTHR